MRKGTQAHYQRQYASGNRRRRHPLHCLSACSSNRRSQLARQNQNSYISAGASVQIVTVTASGFSSQLNAPTEMIVSVLSTPTPAGFLTTHLMRARSVSLTSSGNQILSVPCPLEPVFKPLTRIGRIAVILVIYRIPYTAIGCSPYPLIRWIGVPC